MANKLYLDKSGLTYLWSKIKAAISGKQDVLTAGRGINISSGTITVKDSALFYGTSATAAGTAAKVVECANFTANDLVAGVQIAVKFTNANTYNGTATLNINSTGAHDVARVGTTKTTRYYWSAGEVVHFVYDGTNFVMARTGTATTTYYGLTKLATSATSTSTSTALTPASLNNAMQYLIGYAAYSSSATYAVGDRVRYGYYVYECNTAITEAEAWNAAHWTALPTIYDQIGDVESILQNLNSGNGV